MIRKIIIEKNSELNIMSNQPIFKELNSSLKRNAITKRFSKNEIENNKYCMIFITSLFYKI